MRDYVEITYNKRDKPFTDYPRQLTQYLTKRYHLKIGYKLLDLGCGRGEYAAGFMRQCLWVCGVDRSRYAENSCDVFIQADLATEPIPAEDNFFDVVFIKSVLEHFYFPEKIVEETHRVLKPGGLLITLTPECTGMGFFADFTHRTPFWLSTVRELLVLCDFSAVRVERFLQVPVLWRSPPLKYLFRCIAAMTPVFIAKRFKWIQHSKGYMILGTGRK